MRPATLFTVAAVLLIVALSSVSWARLRLAPESAPVARGAMYAQTRGCVNCHGLPNDPVTDANDSDCSNVNTMGWHPDYAASCRDVIAYFETVRLRRSLDDRLRDNASNLLVAGEALARKYHCFQCHGKMGQGGFANAGSLKGYVPGYFGGDFNLLTNNGTPKSVRRWIVDGMDPAIVQQPLTGPIARFFFWNQAVSMPSFKSLPADEIDVLVQYVIAINEFGPMTADVVRVYAEQTRGESE